VACKYATSTLMIAIESVLVNETAENLATWAETLAEPLVDARLVACGYTLPISPVPNCLKVVASMWACALVINAQLGRYTLRDAPRAASLMVQVDDFFNKLSTGFAALPGVTRSSSGGEFAMADTSKDQFDEDTAIVGVNPEDWQWPEESRA
jgi:hypothetical protein